MIIREAAEGELRELLQLYAHLHSDDAPPAEDRLESLWAGILRDENHHILVGVENGALVSSCVLVLVPNLTRGGRPYALIENVVTHSECRGKGFATRILERATQIARQGGCYKIMLMTGSKQESTLKFYERAGFNRGDKTAFIRWL